MEARASREDNLKSPKDMPLTIDAIGTDSSFVTGFRRSFWCTCTLCGISTCSLNGMTPASPQLLHSRIHIRMIRHMQRRANRRMASEAHA
jgi:hypothetical protein